MATAGAAGRNLTREEVIALLLERLNRENANLTRDEVSAIVDGIGSVDGYYDYNAIHRAGEESLRLWASRDQAGLICTLKMGQEDQMEIQKKMQEEHAQAQARIEALEGELAEVRLAFLVFQAKVQENMAEGTRAQDSQGAQEEVRQAKMVKLEEKLVELERKFAAFEAKELEEGGEPEDEKAEKELSEEEKKEMEAWGHLEDYDQAFEVLCKEGERNDLTKFKSRSAEIEKNHGLPDCVTSLIPGLYSDPLKRLGNSVKLNFQPFKKDLPALMDFHRERKPKFDEKVTYVANKTKGKALIPGMKGQARCESKAAFKYTDATGTSWHRLTDIVRATILYDDIQSMYEGLNVLEKLHEEKALEIIEFNDRYQKPMPGNYRDLQLAVKVDGMVCELQLNTKVMAFVKGHAGHRNFEVARELIAAVKESDARRCDEILQWGTELLGAKSVQEIVNEKKKPVLHEAASTGNADLVSIFLHYKADVNLRSRDGQTALHKAMAGGYERAAWALICAGATFVADEQGVTPLMEGLLKLRVSPSDESVARSVSTIAQKCVASEFDHLSEKLEELTQQRLVQSSDLVIACKDANVEKVERLLREWADPNSRDSSDQLHVVHAALHGGRMDFSPDRIIILRKVLEFRANLDATLTLNGKPRTALEVALRSSDRRAVAVIAELLKRGAGLMNRPVRNWLPPWTAQEIQGAEPKELVRHFLATWPPFCRDLMNVDHSLRLKEGLLELLLFRGYEATKQCDAPEEMKGEVARYMANMLERCGHFWESEAVQAECCSKDISAPGPRWFVRWSPRAALANGQDLVLSHTLTDASNSICSVSFGMPFLAAGGWGDKVRIYNSDQEFTLVKTLEDASNFIRCTSWSQNLLLAAGGGDNVVRIYDAAQEFSLMKTLRDATNVISSLSWSGQFLAAGSFDRKVRVFDAAQDFVLTRSLDDALDAIVSTSWSGQLLAAAGDDKKIRIYDSSEEFVQLKILEDATSGILSLAWGDNLLAAAAGDKQIRIYKSNQDFVLGKTLQDASQPIRSVFWSGQFLAAAGDDKKVWVYDSCQEFALVKTLKEASGDIFSIFWSSRFLAVGGADRKVRIYHQAQDQKGPDTQLADFWSTFINVAVRSGAEGGIDALVHAAVAARALAVGQDRDAVAQQKSLQSAALMVAQKLRALGWPNAAEEILRSYAVEDFGAVTKLDHSSKSIWSMSWSPQLLAAGGADEKIRIYHSLQDTEELTLARTLDDASKTITSVCWNQQLLAAACADNKVRIYNSEQEYALVRTLTDASNWIRSLAWGQKLLASAGDDRKIRIYDSSQDFALLQTFGDASDWILSLAWSEQLLAAAGRDNKIWVYNSVQEFALVKTLADASAKVLCLAWGGQLLAAAGMDRTIWIYNASEDFALVKNIADASDSVNALAWGQQLLAAGGDDRTIRIYDSSAQEWPLMKIVVVPSEVYSLEWCGQYLGVGLRGGQLLVLDSEVQCGTLEEARLWDLASKAEQK